MSADLSHCQELWRRRSFRYREHPATKLREGALPRDEHRIEERDNKTPLGIPSRRVDRTLRDRDAIASGHFSSTAYIWKKRSRCARSPQCPLKLSNSTWPVSVWQTSGKRQSGSWTARPDTTPEKSRVEPTIGSGRCNRRQAADTATGSRTSVLTVTMWDKTKPFAKITSRSEVRGRLLMVDCRCDRG